MVLTGCLHLCGGHFGVLQLVAWGQMLVEYTGEKGLIRGTIETFDGEHPCDLCRSITEAKQEQPPLERTRSGGLEIKNLLIPETSSLAPPKSQDPPLAYHLPPLPGHSLVFYLPDTPPPRV
ncbi:MAG: hypothetical protein AAGB14_09730 [Verrucomicrobiota bacterium]